MNIYDVEVGGMKSVKDEEKERWIEGREDQWIDRWVGVRWMEND